MRNTEKKRKYKLDANLLKKKPVEIVKERSWDTNANKTYKMKSHSNYWINDRHDG